MSIDSLIANIDDRILLESSMIRKAMVCAALQWRIKIGCKFEIDFDMELLAAINELRSENEFEKMYEKRYSRIKFIATRENCECGCLADYDSRVRLFCFIWSASAPARLFAKVTSMLKFNMSIGSIGDCLDACLKNPEKIDSSISNSLNFFLIAKNR